MTKDELLALDNSKIAAKLNEALEGGKSREEIEAWAGTPFYVPDQGIFYMVVAAAGVVIAFAVGFVLTWLFWRPKEE